MQYVLAPAADDMREQDIVPVTYPPQLLSSSEGLQDNLSPAELVQIDVLGMADTAAEQRLLRQFVVQHLLDKPGHLSKSSACFAIELEAAAVSCHGIAVVPVQDFICTHEHVCNVSSRSSSPNFSFSFMQVKMPYHS